MGILLLKWPHSMVMMLYRMYLNMAQAALKSLKNMEMTLSDWQKGTEMTSLSTSACTVTMGSSLPEKGKQVYLSCALCRQKHLQNVQSLQNTAWLYPFFSSLQRIPSHSYLD